MPNYYFVKLSCPKSTTDMKFQKIISNCFSGLMFSETLMNIPNKLNDANDGDYVFLQLGGDSSNKRRYFETEKEYKDFENAIYAVGIIKNRNIEGKKFTADFYPFETGVSKLDLYLYPQFIDNLGCSTKGTPNQAGLYELKNDVALSFIEYLVLNNKAGLANKIFRAMSSNGLLKNTAETFFKSNKSLLTLPSSNVVKEFLSSSEVKLNPELTENTRSLSFDTDQFIKSLLTSNLYLHENLTYRFISSMQTKPFVILTGLSGSGKTKLAEALSLWITDSTEQYCMVAVGADWTNREPLLGFPNALEKGTYVKPDSGVLDLILNAEKDPNRPYFLILDEMNMSHVERYFADFLSAMESTDRSISLRPDSNEWNDCDVPSTLILPKNLFIVGTVNIDETTYMFSPKVLDRANVIEFRVSDNEMESYFNSPNLLNMDGLRGQGASMGESFVSKSKEAISVPDNFGEALMPFFSGLQEVGSEFGYRTASEISRFVAICTETAGDNMNDDEVIDAAIMQKILPKIHGSRNKVEKILSALGSLCLKDVENKAFEINADKSSDKYEVKYPLSYEKLKRMHKSVVSDGFTSFAEA